MKTKEEIILIRDAFLLDGLKNERKDAYTSFATAQVLSFILDDPELKPNIKESIETAIKAYQAYQEILNLK